MTDTLGSNDQRKKHSLVETTILALVVSLLWAVTGTERIFDHDRSGWGLVALPGLVLLAYWLMMRFRNRHQG